MTIQARRNCPGLPGLPATAPLALSSSERRDPAHFARLRPLRRPSRPKQHRDFHQTERRLTSHRSVDIAQARKKGGLKFLLTWVTPLLFFSESLSSFGVTFSLNYYNRAQLALTGMPRLWDDTVPQRSSPKSGLLTATRMRQLETIFTICVIEGFPPWAKTQTRGAPIMKRPKWIPVVLCCARLLWTHWSSTGGWVLENALDSRTDCISRLQKTLMKFKKHTRGPNETQTQTSALNQEWTL